MCQSKTALVVCNLHIIRFCPHLCFYVCKPINLIFSRLYYLQVEFCVIPRAHTNTEMRQSDLAFSTNWLSMFTFKRANNYVAFSFFFLFFFFVEMAMH